MSSYQNVDPAEIAKFESVASQWWDLDGEFKPLHQINPVRLQFIENHVSGLYGKTIIDVGCGGGILSESMARVGANVTGIDMGLEPLQVAKLHGLEAGIQVTYEQIPVEEKAEQNKEAFDVVTCMEMLEHVPDPAAIVKACADMVKPGGYVFFSTLSKTWKAYALAIVAAEHLLKLVPKGTHDHAKFIKPATLISWASHSGLIETAMAGIHFNPITDSIRLSTKVDVNYLLCCRKPV